MRTCIRLVLCAAALTALLTGAALAAEGTATEGYTTAKENCTVTYDENAGTYTASYNGAQDGKQYALLVVKYDGADTSHYTISKDTIMYIDQAEAENNTVSFKFIPRSTPDCVVLLGGTFDGATSPLVLGTLTAQGVTVSGSVTLQGRSDYSGATVTLTSESGIYSGTTGSDGSYTISGVPEGTYQLQITMPGYLSYVKEGLEVDATPITTPTLLGGDVNATPDGNINGQDLAIILENFLKTAREGVDINGDERINGVDLSIVLTNFLKKYTD